MSHLRVGLVTQLNRIALDLPRYHHAEAGWGL